MTSGRTHARSQYLTWVKTHASARFNLATSGILNYPLADLTFSAELAIEEPNPYGHVLLRERIAHRYGVQPECVVTANGASMANHLALAALVESGDEILIEEPAYEPLVSLAAYLGARIRRFPRRSSEEFAIDPADIEKTIAAETRLILITNLHNPSGALTDEDTLRRIGKSAQRVGAKVVVNEAYLDVLFDHRPQSAACLGDHFVVTNSLTKAYGLSALRCGWILCEPGLADRMWKLNDLFGQLQPHPIERLSVLAFDHLDRIAARAQTLLQTNRSAVERFLAARDDLETTHCAHGTTVFPRLRSGDVDEFCGSLLDRYETSVVPGRFFGMPEHFRIGMGGDTAMTAEGLERLRSALDDRLQNVSSSDAYQV